MNANVQYINGLTPVPRLPDGAWSVKEGEQLRISVMAPSPVRGATLGGLRLPLVSVERVGEAWRSQFDLQFHTWAGRALVHVDTGAEPMPPIALDVEPHPGKLGLAAFREMLDELTALSRNLPWGFSPGSHGAERDRGSPAVVHPAVLEVELPILFDALDRLRADLLTRTERTRNLEPWQGNREIDGRSFRWLLSHPLELQTIRDPEATGASKARVFVEQKRTVTTLDHPATRAIKFNLARLERLMRRTQEALRGHRSEPRALELAASLDANHARLRKLLRRAPFHEIVAEPPGPGAMLALADHPSYSRVHRLLHRLLDPGVRLTHDGDLQASLRHTWELFELVVLYRLARALRSRLGPAWTWTDRSLSTGSALSGPRNGLVCSATGPDGRVLELRYQQTFHSWPSEDREFQSISGERIPDYLLLLKSGDARPTWIVLDAKYRSSREAVIEGLRDLHVYRDALRWCGTPPLAGFIVVPTVADRARAFTESSYFERFAFGALSIETDNWMAPALEWLGLSCESESILANAG